MAELTYYVASTVDHFIAGPNGEADASLFFYEGDHVSDFLSFIQKCAGVLMGSNTYEFGFQFGLSPGEPSYKGVKHYIFSSSLSFESNDDVQLISGNAIDYVKELKANTEGTLWLCGGGGLAGSLLDAGLLDKLILKVNPIIIQQGIPLFGASERKIKLTLLDLKHYQNGIILPTYKIDY
ncbi:dihydrofolate reductase family protein [Olivibacter sp. SDN3]|uniref:dihydrofolate reductase family protein n=1 Tax=Olivibacter sp. SDN3 TaxID=2764720 RepID=UPI001650EF98|nr:dihydrofolate reductase family protein [Olivibacter sp. SDN3]QNL49399.1 dihydrofolate reductase family protein [Olivibacter sp. SDN3]